MAHPQLTTAHPSLSRWLERPVVLVGEFDDFQDAERARAEHDREDRDASVYLGVGVAPLWVVVVPVEVVEARADRPAARPAREVRPEMPGEGGVGETTEAAPPRRPLRRVRPAETPRVAMLRLLNDRCRKVVAVCQPCDADGVLLTLDDVCHAVSEWTSGGRTGSSLDLGRDEMDRALSALDHRLHEAGYDLEADRARYEAREAARAEAFGALTTAGAMAA